MATSIVDDKFLDEIEADPQMWFLIDITAENFWVISDRAWILAFKALKGENQPNTARVFGSALKWLKANKDQPLIEGGYNDLKKALVRLSKTNELALKAKNRYYAVYRKFYQFVDARAKSNDIEWKNPFVEKIDLPDFVQPPNKSKKSTPIKDEIITKEQIGLSLQLAKKKGFMRYIMAGLMVFDAPRPSEVITIHRDYFLLESRYFHTGYEIGAAKSNKTKELDTGLLFIIPEDMIPVLEMYLEMRDEKYPDSKWLFPNPDNPSKHVSINFLNNVTVCKFRGKYYDPTQPQKPKSRPWLRLCKDQINQRFTLYWYRNCLDTYRKAEGCPDNVNHHLMNHVVNDAEFQSYDQFNLNQLIEWFDRYNPYKGLYF